MQYLAQKYANFTFYQTIKNNHKFKFLHGFFLTLIHIQSEKGNVAMIRRIDTKASN